MNKRFLLYGIVALVLVLLLAGDGDSASESTAFPLSVRQQAAFKNECMKEIVGFDQAARSKFLFCDCVTEKFETRINANEELIKIHEAFVAKYLELKEDPRSMSRSLASRNVERFTSGSDKGDILLSSMVLRYPFSEMKEVSENLVKGVEQDWKKTLIECSSVETPLESK
jgi:hypothetical protein